jgi:hypothetical protein
MPVDSSVKRKRPSRSDLRKLVKNWRKLARTQENSLRPDSYFSTSPADAYHECANDLEELLESL